MCGVWTPSRYLTRWKKYEVKHMLNRAGRGIMSLNVTNQERKEHWIKVVG